MPQAEQGACLSDTGAKTLIGTGGASNTDFATTGGCCISIIVHMLLNSDRDYMPFAIMH